MRSIVGELGTQKFARLRVGIGEPSRNAIGHVLTRFAGDERRVLDEVLDAAADAVEDWAHDGANRAANRWNAWTPPSLTDERLGRQGRPTTRSRERSQPTQRHRAHDDGLAKAAAPWLKRQASASAAERRASDASPSKPLRDATERAVARVASGDSATGGTPRARLPNLSALTTLLASGGEIVALAERYRTVREGRVGQNLRHVTYANMPHGAKTFLAAALAVASERAPRLDRARLGDRRSRRRRAPGMAR